MNRLDLLLLARRNSAGLRIPAPVPLLATGTNLVNNGDMESGDPPTGWTAQNAATLSSQADERTGGSGSQSLQAVRGTGNAVAVRAVTGESVGKWYQWGIWLRNTTSTFGVGVVISNAAYTGTVPPSPGIASTNWTHLSGSVRMLVADCNVTPYVYTNGAGRFDDAEVYELSTASLFSLRSHASADVDISAAITRPASGYWQVGLAARVDSAANPQNFVQALSVNSNGAHSIQLVKCVAGTYTTVEATGGVTYVAGARLRLVCSGNSASVYYNGVQIGSTQTISDAGIISNTLHGLFSTSADAVFSGTTMT